MKKTITALVLLLPLFVYFALMPRQTVAEDIKRSDADIVTWQIGASSDIALGVSSQGIVYNTEGLVNVREAFVYLTAPSTFNVVSLVVTTTSLTAAPTYFWGTSGNSIQRITQPRFPSPIIFKVDFQSGQSTQVFKATATVSGTDSTGSSRTVHVQISSHVASTGYAYTYISTITIGVFNTTGPHNNGVAYLSFGTTNQIGLANDILSPGDVYAAWENNVSQSSITANSDYNTWTPNILPNYDVTTSSMVRNRHSVLYRAPQSPPRRVGPGMLMNLP